MARIRSVKPELADDEKLGSISRDARLLFIMMWCQSDDFGVVKGNLRWLQAQIFPYDPVKSEQFKKWVSELISINSIIPFETNGEKYFYIKNFQKHQVINKPSKQARNPEPPKEMLREDYRSTTVVLPEDYAEEGKGREGKGTGREQERKEIHTRDSFFEEFWKEYPERNGKKVGKAGARDLFCNPGKIKDEEVSLVLKAVRNYANSTGCRAGYARDAVRFLRSGFWKEWLEPEKEKSKPDPFAGLGEEGTG